MTHNIFANNILIKRYRNKGLYTLDIFAHNIEIKRLKDILITRYFFSLKDCNDISKYLELSQKIFSIHTGENILDEKCLLPQYLFIAIL
jgi:hypothetical protein